MNRKLIIEIGTNTIKALCAERDGSVWNIVMEDLYPVRIGAGKAETGKLSTEGMERSLSALAAILHKHSEVGISGIHVIATESLRSAINADAFITSVKNRFGLTIEILSGREEAHYSFLAAVSGIIKTDGMVAVLDIGGGSTELTIAHKNEIVYQQSYPIGAVKLTEKFFQSDSPAESEMNALRTFLSKQMQDLSTTEKITEMIGVGGTITTLALLSIPQEKALLLTIKQAIKLIDGTQLNGDQISGLIKKLKALTISEKESMALMPNGRADIILAGTLILDEFMHALNLQKITVSTRGVRHGYLY